MSTIEHPAAKGLLLNLGFSQVIVATGNSTVYTAGQVSIGERGELVGGGYLVTQTAQEMRNVGLALASARAGYADVVKIIIEARTMRRHRQSAWAFLQARGVSSEHVYRCRSVGAP